MDGSDSTCKLLFLLTIIFMVLKLTNTITWSWWFVFMPLLIPIGTGVLLSAVMIALLMIAVIFK